ncbi:MAG TPA: LuxR C-terminal-related transcriptional regulator [Acidimicrobiales bacterium]
MGHDPDVLIEAGALLARGAWVEARDAFDRVLAGSEDPQAWEGRAFAARLLGDHAASFAGYERAYQLHRERGDRAGAGRAATWLGYNHATLRGDIAVARGWYRRAHRLLDELAPAVEQAWLAVREAEMALVLDHDSGAGLDLARQARRVAAAAGDAEVELVAQGQEGLALVIAGRPAAGMRLLDDAAAALIAGDLASYLPTAMTCCYVIYGCEHVVDVERAAQWCDVIEEHICARIRFDQLVGFCRCHYAGVLMARGDLAGAEVELDAAERSFATGAPAAVFEVIVRRAELRRRQQRPAAARRLASLVQWHPDALRCLAAVALDEGDLVGAGDLAERHLRRLAPDSALARAPGLALAATVAARRGLLDDADRLIRELWDMAEPTPAIKAMAAAAGAEAAEAAGDHERARRLWEDAIDMFDRAGTPYDAGQARAGLARALQALGRPIDADREAERAASSLASLQAARVDRSGILSRRELDVVDLVAQGLTDSEIAQRLHLSVHTVHRHVANIRTKLDQPSRAAAVAEASRRGLLAPGD